MRRRSIIFPIIITFVRMSGNRTDFLRDKKILLVDDEPEVLDMIESLLRDEGFSSVTRATTTKESLEQCRLHQPDLAILDVMLPDGDGFSLFKEIRKSLDFPILFLTARDQPDDLLEGLGLGADDYMVKPFLPRELILRIYAILRRSYKADDPLIVLNGCTVDVGRAEAYRNGEIFPLTAKEVKILITLYNSANRIVTIDSICNSVWGDNRYGYENSLMAHICRIREKIEENASSPSVLITVKGLGYKLNISQ
ncbi:DNA-binding response OmpR family regulator [Chryseobacterium sp. H1D6B]|uniref:response regulator transcription factor n=1 Tax=Chryseobacterium sp. H1D6B TaxID=2940588 RepID=UPI00179EFC50|nr:response regulator transcription factor [Chryseobacterium sp. H1D6B]MDH6252413.1 DNA-binding response OmpR family regulator [Chryseobacterium sp. H1D6B]